MLRQFYSPGRSCWRSLVGCDSSALPLKQTLVTGISGSFAAVLIPNGHRLPTQKTNEVEQLLPYQLMDADLCKAYSPVRLR